MSIGKINSYAIFFLLTTLPLIYLPNTFNPYEFPKFIFFVGAVFLLLLFNLGRFWSRRSTPPQNDGRKMPIAFKIDALTKLVLIYGFVVYLSDIFGIDPRMSFLGSQFRHQGFITLLAGICLFLVVRNSRNGQNGNRGILLGAFFVCLFSLWQTAAFYLFNDKAIPTYQGRIVGTLGNPNSLAGYLVMVLPFVFTMPRIIVRILLASLILTVIIFTDSRSAFLAVGFAFLIYGIVFIYRLKLWRNIIVILLVITIVALFTLLLTNNTYPPFRSLFGHLKGDFSVTNQALIVKERGCPESWPTEYPLKLISDIYNSKIFRATREAPCDNRFLIWVVGLEALSKRPILGYGQENFEIAVPPGKMHSADNAHNIFLETAVSSGVIGLLLFVAITVIAIKKANFPIKMSLLGFLIVAQFNPLSIVEIGLFWFLLGLDNKHLYI